VVVVIVVMVVVSDDDDDDDDNLNDVSLRNMMFYEYSFIPVRLEANYVSEGQKFDSVS
jgi:hypothetical protein